MMTDILTYRDVIKKKVCALNFMETKYIVFLKIGFLWKESKVAFTENHAMKA
jgi:hypothetical protein